MKCFYHPTVDAVGICKSCNRGLCPDCIANVGTSCSCKNRCEADVAAINEMLQRGRTAHQKTSSTYLRSGIIMALIGVVFVLFGLGNLNDPESSGSGRFFLVFGILVLGLAGSFFVTARRFRQN
ncbi:MAG TPA: hypothetical protein VL171_15895 [Verrucomicrobiae bacterium]|nr:hypothetical protein [Verrucomicrobiae bacterium]